MFFPKNFQKILKWVGIFLPSGTEGSRKGKLSPAFAVAEGGETMNEPIRTQWQIRCAFTGYCKRSLENEKLVTYRDMKCRQLREVTFSDLTPQEENQLYTYDSYFVNDEAEQSFYVAGKEISAKLLAEALHFSRYEKCRERL